jgi:hypothetical protein
MLTKDGPLSALKTIPSTADVEQLEMSVRAMSEKFGAERRKPGGDARHGVHVASA